jgi:hypothetical protein
MEVEIGQILLMVKPIMRHVIQQHQNGKIEKTDKNVTVRVVLIKLCVEMQIVLQNIMLISQLEEPLAKMICVNFEN